MKNKQHGFTLLEIFIALAIGLVIIGGTLSVFVGLKTTTTETSSMGELQENGRFAVSIITDDLLRQNFWGDFSGNLNNGNIPLGLSLLPAAQPNGDCVGGGINNGSFPQAAGAFRTLWAQQVDSGTSLLNGCITNAAYDSSTNFNSDVIQIKRAVATAFTAPVVPADLSNNRYYIQSNLTSANILPGNIAVIPTLTGARIWEYQHHVYYIREDAIGTSGEVVPVLMQGRLQRATNAMSFNMLVEGIERIHYMFGVDTDGDGIVNAYISSENMTENYWDNANNVRILAVKLYVLVRAIREDNNYTNDNVYQMGNRSFDADGDNYRRLLFSSTVSLYNARVESW